MRMTRLLFPVLVAVLGLAGCSSEQHPRSTASTDGTTQTSSDPTSQTSDAVAGTSRKGPSAAQAVCSRTVLTLEVADAEGGGTGQTAVLITLRNTGHAVCRLTGYPRLTPLDADGKVLPFRIRYGGSQSVTNQQPVAVVIRPGGTAFVTFGKFRCDVGDVARIKEVKMTLPNTASSATLDLASLSSGLSYCGPGDLGSELAVSPVEPTAATTRSH